MFQGPHRPILSRRRFAARMAAFALAALIVDGFALGVARTGAQSNWLFLGILPLYWR